MEKGEMRSKENTSLLQKGLKRKKINANSKIQ